MATVNESNTSGEVVTLTLTLGGTVAADAELKTLATPVLTTRKTLKQSMRARQDADDEVRLAHGGVVVSESTTDTHLPVFAGKVAGRYIKPGTPGEKSAEFARLFDGKTAATLLRDGRADRTQDLKDLVTRINATATSPDVKKDAADLLKVIAHELAAVTAEEAAIAAFAATLEKEATARTATVVSARACTNLVKAQLAADLPRVRKLLGQSAPGGKRKSKAEIAKAKRAEADRLAELARKATALAAAADEDARDAEEEAKAEAAAPPKKSK